MDEPIDDLSNEDYLKVLRIHGWWRAADELVSLRSKLPTWRKGTDRPPADALVLVAWGDRSGIMTVVKPELVEPYDQWMPLPEAPK